MFERSMLDGSGGRVPGRKWWLVPAARAIHFTVFLGISIASMWDLDELLPEPPPPRPTQRGCCRCPPPVRVLNGQVALCACWRRGCDSPVPWQPVAAPVAIAVTKPEPFFICVLYPENEEAPGTDADTGDSKPSFVTGNIRPPVVIHRVEPPYTELALRARIQGEVIIEVVIDKQGNVVDARILKGLGGGLNEKSIRAVERWKFRPATLKGRPIAVYFNVTVTFRRNRG